MNVAQMIALAEWLQQEIKKLQPDYKETDIGKPSAMELAQRGRRETALANRPAATTGTLQGELEAAEIPTAPSLPVPSTENLLQYRTREGFHTSPYKRYPGTLSSYSIPQRGIEPPDIHVDPSGQARIVSDYYDSIVNYRKSKTLGGAKVPPITEGDIARSRNIANLEAFSPVEQAIPDRGLPENVPEWALIQQEQMKAQNYLASEARKREVEKLRATQAGKTSKFDELIKRYQRAASKRLREMNRRSRGGMPFNPKLLESQGKFLPTGNPIQRALQRRLR